MSVKITTQVWEHSRHTGTRKLVLLALADAANQEGLCWPSMQTIARMACCSVRRAREHVTALTEEDWVERREKPGTSNWYLVHLPEKLQIATGILPPAPDQEPPDMYPGEISPDYDNEESQDNDPGEISPGGRRNLAGGGGEISPGEP